MPHNHHVMKMKTEGPTCKDVAVSGSLNFWIGHQLSCVVVYLLKPIQRISPQKQKGQYKENDKY